MQYCGKCGNVIPDWAHSVCPTCRKIERDYRIRDNSSRSLNINKYRKTGRYLGNEWQVYGYGYLLNFNRLLEHIFGSEIHFSDILSRAGGSKKQILEWRKDRLWIISFLERFERRLVSVLREYYPELNPSLLLSGYLDNKSIQQIAGECGLSVDETELNMKVLSDYLRSEQGKRIVENLIWESAKATL
jgi:hypothetical protein